MAAEALASLGEAALEPMLRALEKRPGSQGLRIGVRHVLRQRKRKDPQDKYLGVLAAIETGATPETAAIEAYRVLAQSKAGSVGPKDE